MISLTGNNPAFFKHNKSKNGFTFFEVMMTAAILAVGIVMIYRSLIIALDYQNHLTNRFFASNFLTDKVEWTQLVFQQKGELPLAENGKVFSAYVNKVPVAFTFNFSVRNVDNFEGILAVDMVLSWAERGRTIHLSRTAYIIRNHT